MIAIDWGTTSFRAFRMRDGQVVDRVAEGPGVMAVAPGGFPRALDDAVGPWVRDGERRILMAGMVGSRQGWMEAPYLPCPADTLDLAAAALRLPGGEFGSGADIRLVPGLSALDPSGVPEVMRGEEVQLAGILHQLGAAATVCLPGTHSKWVRVAAGRIDGFTTHMTGEAFAALRHHTILGRLIGEGPHDPAAFAGGVARSAEPGGLLHHLFGVRTLGLFGRLDGAAAGSFLSGLLIGHEVRAAPSGPDGTVYLVGNPGLCALYAAALAATGRAATVLDADAAAAGLWHLSEHIAWT